MSIAALAILILIVLAVGGWFAFWCAEDKLTDQRVDLGTALLELATARAALAEANEVAVSWQIQAHNLETSCGLLHRELERLGVLTVPEPVRRDPFVGGGRW